MYVNAELLHELLVFVLIAKIAAYIASIYVNAGLLDGLRVDMLTLDCWMGCEYIC